MEVPLRFMCSITHDVMENPVMDREGHNFERAAILQWLARNPTCPMGREPLTAAQLFFNRGLKEEIEEWRGGGTEGTAATSSCGLEPPRPPSAAPAPPPPPPFAYALVGKSGHGKSSSANSLSDSDHFQLGDDFDSVTGAINHLDYDGPDGNRYRVVDTLGLFDTQRTFRQVLDLLAGLTHACPHGVDAFVVTLRIGRMTEEELCALDLVEKSFGPTVWASAVLLFTHCDDPLDALLAKIQRLPIDHKLRQAARAASMRVAKIENRGGQDALRADVAQIHQLLLQARQQAGRRYDNQLFEVARQQIAAVEQDVGQQGRDLRQQCSREVSELKALLHGGRLTMAEYEARAAAVWRREADFAAQRNALELERIKKAQERSDAIRDLGVRLLDCTGKGVVYGGTALAIGTGSLALARGMVLAGRGMLYAGLGAFLLRLLPQR